MDNPRRVDVIPDVVRSVDRRGGIDPGIENRDRILGYLSDEARKDEVEGLLQNFDLAISTLNTYVSARWDLRDDLKNLQGLKTALSEKPPLPTMQSLLHQDRKSDHANFQLLYGALEQMSDLMMKGQRGEKEPWMKFHMTKTGDDSALFVGALFHAYEEFLFQMPAFAGAFDRDEVVCGLIEVMLLNPPEMDDSHLYHAVVDYDKLNWVRGYDGFDPRLRLRTLGEPIKSRIY
ncbi:MAG: hypothetical protein ACMG6E_00045 [Candidatus Roizmanbacteria bacterium]